MISVGLDSSSPQYHFPSSKAQQNLELEALRLSLTNMHTAQLELSQTNMQKEKEAALSELQASLRDKWAQESAMLQARQQFELERVRELTRQQEERLQQQHQGEMGKTGEEGGAGISHYLLQKHLGLFDF